jgi:hypothetical protein
MSSTRLLGVLFGLFGLVFGLPEISSAQGAPRSTKSAKVNRAKDSDHTMPLKFDVLGDGIELPARELEYDASGENNLNIAGLDLNSTSLSAKILKGKKLHSRLAKSFGEDAEQFFFLFQWPEGLLPEGNLEMISRSGRVVLRFDLNDEGKEEWRRQLATWRTGLIAGGLPKAQAEKAPLFKIGFGQRVEAPRKGSAFEPGLEPFRFCLTKNYDLGFTRLCTPMYEVRLVKKVPVIVLLPLTSAPPRIIAFNESAPLKNSVPVAADQKVQFFAELANGMSYEFLSSPLPLNLVEMNVEPGATEARLVSWGPRPSLPVKELNREEEGFFDKIGFQQTIGDLREFWELRIPLNNTAVYLPGTTGGIFKQQIVINKLPSESIRPYLDSRTIEASYVDGVKIFGRAGPGSKLSTKQNSIEPRGGQEFVWYFQNRKRGETNRSYLTIKNGDQEFRAYHEMYKGYPRELSTRLSGIVSSEGSLVMMGELAFNYWFEDIFGWTNYYLARQRWGLSTKYFQSLTNFSLASSSATSTNTGILKVVTADLKYRLSPGLWNRDESWGLMGSYQKINYLSFDSAFTGGGIFWARSMPKIFDDLFNILPMFRYPKWVDADFILYFLPGDAKTKINSVTYALNFHGKVMWTNAFFGEAGFGVKQYGFQDSTTLKKLQFGSLYGTVGLGLNF